MYESISDGYKRIWLKPSYQSSAYKCFQEIDAYLAKPPTRILDIGCGYAHVSEHFQKKYNCELWLLDGDFEATVDRPRKNSWGDVDNMKFYLSVEDLKQYWNSRGMRYTFVDATKCNIDNAVTFDLVYSRLSCGFHYPAKTYKSLVEKHTNKHSVCIFDFRTKALSVQSVDIEVIHDFKMQSNKRSRLHFKFT